MIIKHLTGDLSDEERRLLDAWLAEDESHRSLFREMTSKGSFAEGYRNYRKIESRKEEALQKVWEQVGHATVAKSGRRSLYRNWLKVACVLAVILAVGIGYTEQMARHPIIPAQSKALLTLEDGRTESLKPASEQRWIYIEDKPVMHAADGVLSCKFPSSVVLKKVHRHTLSVPRGGEYHLVLSDGTKVHLNALSQLTFPIDFRGMSYRTVQLTGEAYFDVAKDSLHPFRIQTQGITVQQIGTSFNVKARTPERVEVALVSGKVKMSSPDGQEETLEAGEWGVWQTADRRMEARREKLEPHTAWHADRFLFYDESLQELMKELSLWYDVDVTFADDRLKELHFTGNLHRYDDIAVILNAIEETVNVRFAVSGHRIKIQRTKSE